MEKGRRRMRDERKRMCEKRKRTQEKEQVRKEGGNKRRKKTQNTSMDGLRKERERGMEGRE